MSGSLGMGIKLIGKRPVPIEGVGDANCNFAIMDAPRSIKESSRDGALTKSGEMSADMDAALRKLENRRVAAVLNQPALQSSAVHRERSQVVSESALQNLCLKKRIRVDVRLDYLIVFAGR